MHENHILNSVIPGEFSTIYQNDCRITEFKFLEEHWFKFKGKNNFLIYAHYRLYVTVVFKVTIVGIVRRHSNQRVNATAYSKTANREPDGSGNFSSFNNLLGLLEAELFPLFYSGLGTLLTAGPSGIDSHMKIYLPSFMSSGIVHK